MIRDIIRFLYRINDMKKETKINFRDVRDCIDSLYEDIKKYEDRGSNTRNQLWKYIKETSIEIDDKPNITSYIDNDNFDYDFNDDGKYDDIRCKIYHIIDIREYGKPRVIKIVMKDRDYYPDINCNKIDYNMKMVANIYDTFYKHIKTAKYLSGFIFRKLTVISGLLLILSFVLGIFCSNFNLDSPTMVLLAITPILFIVTTFFLFMIDDEYSKYIKTINSAINICEYARNIYFPCKYIYDETYKKDNVTICIINK